MDSQKYRCSVCGSIEYSIEPVEADEQTLRIMSLVQFNMIGYRQFVCKDCGNRDIHRIPNADRPENP